MKIFHSYRQIQCVCVNFLLLIFLADIFDIFFLVINIKSTNMWTDKLLNFA